MTGISNLQSALSDRYEILHEIGHGGMATVYLARDIRHERQVALKVLNPELGAVIGVDRFLAEIRVTANLQHPNLLPLFDSGEARGLLFYVMPFVEGESLRAKLERERQLPIDDAAHIATAVAGGLAYAHARGVIHRDLKPENILLHAGEPVVADFGIALAVSAAGGARMTQTGISLGTPQYMSPEQAAGDRAIDSRTDVYSLGAVTYEMLTGEPPHTGPTVQAIVARVLTETPHDVRMLRPAVPAHIAEAVAVALEKLPADRWSTARELADALQGRSVRRQATPIRISSRREWVRPLVLAFAAGVLGGTALVMLMRRSRPLSRKSIQFVALQTEGATGSEFIALSRDGSMLAYVKRPDSARQEQLFVRDLGTRTPRVLSGTEGAERPFFSPDGKWIGYSANGKLWRIPSMGGAKVEIADLSRPADATWLGDGSIVFTSDRSLHRLGPDARDQVLLRPDTSTQQFIRSIVLDDDRTVIFTIAAGDIRQSRLAVTTVDGERPVVLPVKAVSCLGTVDNWLITVRADGTLMAVPWDRRRRRIIGSEVALEETAYNESWAVMAALSPSGTLAVATGRPGVELVWVNDRGVARPLVLGLAGYAMPRLSPDGRRILVAADAPNGRSGYWVYELATSTLTRLITDTLSYYGEWLPDNRTVIYGSGKWLDPTWSILRRPIDGISPPSSVLADGKPHYFGIGPDGRTLVYSVSSAGSQSGAVMIRAFVGDTTSHQIFGMRGDEWAFRVSPHGEWLAYASSESGSSEVYVRPLRGPGPRVQLSSGGGIEPVWSRDGRRIFYRSLDARTLYAVTIANSPTLSVASRTKLFEGVFDSNTDVADYDVSLDGNSFLMVRYPNFNRELVVTVNWADVLRQRLRATQ